MAGHISAMRETGKKQRDHRLTEAAPRRVMTGTVVCTTVTVRTMVAHCGGVRRSQARYVTVRGPSTRVLMGRPVTTIEAVKLPSTRSKAVQPGSWQQGQLSDMRQEKRASHCDSA
jgi:hypothetical protein